MSSITYYVAMPFVLNEEGQLTAGEAQDRQSSGAAIRAAEALAQRYGGAVAFSRTGDPAKGLFESAVVLRSFGEVPSMSEMMGKGWSEPQMLAERS